MKLTDAQIKVLAAIYKWQVSKGRLRFLGPGFIGGQVWGDGRRKPQAYARTAGRVLQSLKEKDLVSYDFERDLFDRGNDSIGWNITTKGKRIMEEIENGKEKGTSEEKEKGNKEENR